MKSTGYLQGYMPKPPSGVFNNAKKDGQTIITWQPQKGLRIALVLVYVSSSPEQFVAAGRSLRETELRESNLRNMVAAAWILCIVIISLSAAINNNELIVVKSPTLS